MAYGAEGAMLMTGSLADQEPGPATPRGPSEPEIAVENGEQAQGRWVGTTPSRQVGAARLDN